MPSTRFCALGPDAYVPDLIHLADVVLGKLGYGFVSECLTMGSPLIYVPRQNWPEERFLEVLYMGNVHCLLLLSARLITYYLLLSQDLLTKEYNAGVCMSRVDFVSGNWGPFIMKAVALRNSWRPLSAAQAGETVLRFLYSISSTADSADAALTSS